MGKILVLSLGLLLAVGITIIFYVNGFGRGAIVSPPGQKNIPKTEKPLEKYTFENLKKRVSTSSAIDIGAELKNANGFASYIFYFKTEGQKVSGLMNIPTTPGTYPVLVLLRGFVDQQIYTTGEGTRRDGEIFAQNGFIALAPDFLGYGESASPSANSIEERFQTYTTVLDLLASINNLNSSLSTLTDNKISAEPQKVGIWGHSNGGQIALSVITITGKNYPTVLWAPVSKFFPYSVLHYTDEFDDRGKKLRKVIADFEKDYDSDLYTFTNYEDWINTPIQLHQGGSDEEVPQKWSDQLVKDLKDKNKDVSYFTYPKEDHNFGQGSWSLIIKRNIEFYKAQFAQNLTNYSGR